MFSDQHPGLGERKVVEVSVGWFGPVRITLVRQRMKHHKSTHWSWVAVHAEKVTG